MLACGQAMSAIAGITPPVSFNTTGHSSHGNGWLRPSSNADQPACPAIHSAQPIASADQ